VVRAPGRLLATAVHRPLAEQLVALTELRGDDRVLELSAGDGELTRRLRNRGATVDVVDLARHPQHRGGPPPFAADSYDIVLSLLALDCNDELASTLRELAGVAARARIVVWEDGAAHESALRAAWRDAGGATANPAGEPASPPSPLPGWSRSVLSDVARFDGTEQLWAALVVERGVDVPRDRAHALRERFAHHLAPFTAADGTLRIPVRAALLARG
jgi:hypothetical protein